MLQIQGGSRIKELSIAVIISAMFCQFGFMVLLYTVPLYTLYQRRGKTDLLIASGIVMVLTLLFAVWSTRSLIEAELRGALIVIELIIPVLLMLGLFFITDIIPGFTGVRRLYRLLSATVAAVIVCVPVYFLLTGNEIFTEAVKSQINAIAGSAFGEGSGSYQGEIVKSWFGEGGIIGYMKDFYLKSAAAIFFLVLLVSARVSEILISRMQKKSALQLIDFTVPAIFLWPTLLAAVGMIVDIFSLLKLVYAVPVIWNAGIILLFIYGLQGLGILRALFSRFNLPPAFRMLVEFVLILLLVMPGVNYFVITGIPVLGISETWINFRKSIRST